MNYRVFVKKKEAFQVESASLFHELKQNLNLSGLQGVQTYMMSYMGINMTWSF